MGCSAQFLSNRIVQSEWLTSVKADYPVHRIPLLLRAIWRAERACLLAPDALGQLQDRLLRRVVQHAAVHVPYYRTLFREHDIDAKRFRGREDMHRIPFLEKDVVRRESTRLTSDNAERFGPVAVKTSGSTGTPLRLLLSSESIAADAAASLLAYRWAGFQVGKKVLTVKDYRQSFSRRYAMFGRSIDIDRFSLTPSLIEQHWQAINALRPGFFHGYPFALFELASLADQAGIVRHQPHTLICFAEALPSSTRARLESLYAGARIFDLYSMTENTVFASETELGNRLVHENYAFHEFVDSSGRSVVDGSCEIIGTSWHNLAMPLIRYRTGDHTTLQPIPGDPSARYARAIGPIEGRREDFVVTPDGRRFNLFEDAMNDAVGVSASQYVQDRLDRLYVNMIPADDFDPTSLARVEAVLRSRLGPDISIEFRVVQALERRNGQSGKIPFVLSRISHAQYSDGDFA